jgi:hypothetical protein
MDVKLVDDSFTINTIASEIEKYWPGLAECGFRKQQDGRILCPDRIDSESTWIYTGRMNNRFCDLWHRVFFNLFHLVPSPCHSCWKVVARPETLSQLFQLAELQKQFGHPGKCGIETRMYIHGLYGAYFYCDSLEEGKRVYGNIAESVSEFPGPEFPLILKRGCTEFEMYGGPSNQWNISEKQLELEKKLNEIFIKRPKDNRRSKKAIKAIHAKWIQWAYAHGDPTYRKFTDAQDLYPPVMTYHEEG